MPNIRNFRTVIMSKKPRATLTGNEQQTYCVADS